VAPADRLLFQVTFVTSSENPSKGMAINPLKIIPLIILIHISGYWFIAIKPKKEPAKEQPLLRIE
jgi:hypothetical protein